MASISQEISLLNESTFELFVHQVLSFQYPSAGIKKVDGAGGDKGIDCFQGLLADGPAIWQCKRFANRLDGSQRRNIIESIETAFRHHTPKCWTLCTNVDLREPEHKWFQENIVSPYSALASIGLMQNSEFSHAVLQYPSLSGAFFPEVGMASLLRLEDRMFGSTDSGEDFEILQKRAEHYLKHLTQRDSRLSAIMLSSNQSLPKQYLPAECLFSITSQTGAIHLVAKDAQALSKDPITLTCTFRDDVIPLLENGFDSGEPIRLPAGSVLGLSSSSPLIQSLLPIDTSFLQFESLPPPPGTFPDQLLRITSGRGKRAKRLDFIRCRRVKAGRKLVTFEGSIACLSITIRITTDGKRLDISFKSDFGKANVLNIEEALEFLYELERSGRLEIFDIEQQRLIYTQNHACMPSVDECFHLGNDFKIVYQNLLSLSKHFHIVLRMPQSIDHQETNRIFLMGRIVTEDKCSGVCLSIGIPKDSKNQDRLAAYINCKNIRIRLYQANGEEHEILGVMLRTGPVVFRSSTAVLQNPDEFISRYEAAKEGETVKISFDCDNCDFSLEDCGDSSSMILNIDGEELKIFTVETSTV